MKGNENKILIGYREPSYDVFLPHRLIRPRGPRTMIIIVNFTYIFEIRYNAMTCEIVLS